MKRFLVPFSAGVAITAALIAAPMSLPPSTTLSPEQGRGFLSAAAAADDNLQNGTQSPEELYTASCQSCHSMRPPAKTAPPIVGLAARYRTVYGNRKDAVNAMVSFMKTPDAGKSALGPKAIQRFGLMPAMALSDKELEKVAGWLWDQYDPDFEPRGNCR